MATFQGTYERTMDGKGRVVVPSELRSELGEVFIAYTADEPCVALMPESEWALLAQRVKERDPFDKRTKRLARLYFGGAHRCTMDEAGRMVVPPVLREAAKLGKDVVFVGALNQIELWDARVWRRTRAELLAEEE